MNPQELRATIGLALIYALRMVGMFAVLPVFALYARQLPVPASDLQIGFAIGAYGLSQALLQIVLGIVSDRIGRKPVIALGLLVFAAGSFIAGASHDIHWIILGRAVQGAGAISSAASALLADLTRESVRATAMAILGAGMGVAFLLALVLGPVAAAHIGVDGIFDATGVLALLAIPVVIWGLATPPQPTRGAMRDSLTQVLQPALLRLNAGILLLHATMTALFIGLPLMLVDTLHLASADHWRVYLPVLLLSVVPGFALMRRAERQGRTRQLYRSAIAMLVVALPLMALGHGHAAILLLGLLAFFTAFNQLEGLLPSMISRQAPGHLRGAAMGVYATGQFLGGFLGGSLGGISLKQLSASGPLWMGAGLCLLWLLLEWRGASQAAPASAARTQAVSR
jgi:MFS family permease